MFVYHRQSSIMLLLLYVDDMLLIGNNPALQSFILELFAYFAMKDLGDVHYFLGVQLMSTPFGLFLSQHNLVSWRAKKQPK